MVPEAEEVELQRRSSCGGGGCVADDSRRVFFELGLPPINYGTGGFHGVEASGGGVWRRWRDLSKLSLGELLRDQHLVNLEVYSGVVLWCHVVEYELDLLHCVEGVEVARGEVGEGIVGGREDGGVVAALLKDGGDVDGALGRGGRGGGGLGEERRGEKEGEERGERREVRKPLWWWVERFEMGFYG
ncbi:hypothetical protein Acr_00g0097200 [Actinidia rufa]|uniref:Uncharacterized protein n=1 Tax=Actinidia rufa TaxID=165716 RepID=A0A7J0DYV1_9ERIC|nr:hypothetical protein Acr_00g0097200 [Actinidia rufa]